MSWVRSATNPRPGASSNHRPALKTRTCAFCAAELNSRASNAALFKGALSTLAGAASPRGGTTLRALSSASALATRCCCSLALRSQRALASVVSASCVGGGVKRWGGWRGGVGGGMKRWGEEGGGMVKPKKQPAISSHKQPRPNNARPSRHKRRRTSFSYDTVVAAALATALSSDAFCSAASPTTRSNPAR